MSTPLSRMKVIAAIDKLPKVLREQVRSIHTSNISLRHGSPSYAKKHRNGLTEEDAKLMVQCRKADMSFREIEGAFKLFPNSGNDAYRVINAFNGAKKRKAPVATAKVVRQPILSTREFKALAKRFAQNNPKAAKTVFKEVVLVKKTSRKMAAAV
jgi:hypothetical protein